MSDVFERIESQIVAIGELLETARRYRPLAEEAHRLFLTSTRIGASVRRASRSAGTVAAEPPEKLERELAALLEAGRTLLSDFLATPRYRQLVETLAAEDVTEATERACEIFADVEPSSALGLLLFPVSAKRGQGILEPEAGIEGVQQLAREGLEPSRAPGVGGDAEIHPIRFYEGAAGIDAAVMLVVDGDAVKLPALRASGIGEILVYTKRLKVPFEVGLCKQSPDDWLEVRPGGYAEYRSRWKELAEEKGFTLREI